MTSIRLRRVADLIRVVVSDLIAREVHDPRLKTVHVTDVRVSPDLRQARLHFSLLSGGAPEREAAAAALAHASGFLRREIAQRVRLRVIPELHFIPDDSMEYAAHIESVLNEIKAEHPDPEDRASGDEEE